MHALVGEISILTELIHPSIMRLHDTFIDDEHYYLVTEYLSGGELFNRIAEKSTYIEKEAQDVCSIVLDAVDHCHARRITHRDIKPENLLLLNRDDDMTLKIADFGFVKRAPGFVLPEILRRDAYVTKTDTWSIGEYSHRTKSRPKF